MQLFIIAFVKSSHRKYLTNVNTSWKATGIANILGNKGGLAISFRLYNTIHTFINVHLVSGQGTNKFSQRLDMMSVSCSCD